jgi:hypothetical protein
VIPQGKNDADEPEVSFDDMKHRKRLRVISGSGITAELTGPRRYRVA